VVPGLDWWRLDDTITPGDGGSIASRATRKDNRNMSDPEQPPSEAAGKPNRRRRILIILFIVVLCVFVGTYLLWVDISNTSKEWWDQIKGSGPYDSLDGGDSTGPDGAGGGGGTDPSTPNNL